MKQLLITLVALFAANIALAQNSIPAQPGLAGSEWQLVSLTSNGAATPAPVANPVTLSFTADGVSGSGGCNTYGTSYTASGDIVAFGPVTSTRMACQEDGQTVREVDYLTALQGAIRYQLSVGRLSLWTADGTELRFTARGAFALIGSQWALQSYGQPDAEKTVDSPVALTLEFTSATGITGFGGCNRYTTTYTAAEDALSIQPLASTKMACEDVLMQTEAALFALLPSVDTAVLSGETLTLTASDGQVLRFTATGAYALQRASWRLSAFVTGGDSIPAMESNAPTLEFLADGTAIGSSGCNSYGGTYTVDTGALTFGDMVSTMMACLDDGVMEQEGRYFAALNTVTAYAIEDGTLILTTTDGQLEFTAAQ